ncbi:MAG: hypothetical protein ACKV2Q_24825 [Planctomycetaceae bacterium]
MAHFRVLIPNSTAKPADELRRVGLGELLRDNDRKPVGYPLSGGPGGLRGLCISWDADHVTQPGVKSPRYEFDAARDSAIEAPADPTHQLAQGRFWLIIDKLEPITPQDLKRQPVDSFEGLLPKSSDPEHVRTAKAERLKSLTRFAGNTVTLGDGGRWTLPNLAELPTCYQFNDAKSEWDTAVEPAFRTTYDRIHDIFQACKNRILWDLVRDYSTEQIHLVLSPAEIEFLATCKPDAMDQAKVAVPFVCEMLALNYRLTPWLIGQLQLLKPSNLWSCLCACTDADELLNLHATVQKKIEQIQACGSNSSSGETALGVGLPTPPDAPSETSGS